ncbi:MAG: hypothetical protein FJ388_16950, partial [Verrucomicrobia bacterium]|nr:hypothetical protein [Verrucomicrobiota bacterium]
MESASWAQDCLPWALHALSFRRRAGRPRSQGFGAMTTRQITLELLLITAVGLATLLPFIGQTRDLSSREIRHAEIAREMAVSGDFLVPTLLGRPYCDKPPVLHAAAALLYRVAGEPSMAL